MEEAEEHERIVQLAEDLGPSYLAVGDAPFGVVVGGGEVVVADVGLANRFRARTSSSRSRVMCA